MESYVMTVVCSPRLSSLARIVSVLHARQAPITSLRYVDGPASSQCDIEVGSGDAALLSAQLRRLVGVLSVDVVRPAVAVAS